jgi:hypothetical protein
MVGDQLQIVRWDPFPPSTSATEAPWLAHDFNVVAERPAYLEALKNYFLDGMDAPGVDFVAQRNTRRSWYHVPMMTVDDFARREPYHGLTRERSLRPNEHKWIKNSASPWPRSFAIGYYNWIGGYTIGQVFRDPDPALADPARAQFIAGTFVFKLLFAEYVPSQIETSLDPLVEAPEWQIQDSASPSSPPINVRLLQVDVAVRDTRSAPTGWVFATFVYDKSMTSEPSRWRRLRAVGLQWGNDDDVTASGVGTIDQSWLASGVPTELLREDGFPFGRHGRLNGPVDNRFSSCIGCHSTAQVVVGASPKAAFRGTPLVPPPPSDCPDVSPWLRNIPAGTPFGVIDGCVLGTPPVGTALHALDYSLQLADALEASLFDDFPNPCAAYAGDLRDVATPVIPPGDRGAPPSPQAMRAELAKAKFRDPRARPIAMQLERKLGVQASRLKVPAVKVVKKEQESREAFRR